MAGPEFIVAAGMIASLATIAHEIYGVAGAINGARKLPKVFQDALPKLNVLGEILEAMKSTFEKDKDAKIESAAPEVLQRCKEKWDLLKGYLNMVIPDPSDPEAKDKLSMRERYIVAFKSVGKRKKVEELLKDLFEQVQMLMGLRTLKREGQEVSRAEELESLQEAITEIKKWKPSLTDDEIGEQPGARGAAEASGSSNIVSHGSHTNNTSNSSTGPGATNFGSVGGNVNYKSGKQ